MAGLHKRSLSHAYGIGGHAKAHLDELLDQVVHGETVVIAVNDNVVVRCTVERNAPESRRAEIAGIEILPILRGHLARLDNLPRHQRDPFDRLMIAQAVEEGWDVVSSDDQWDACGVTRLW